MKYWKVKSLPFRVRTYIDARKATVQLIALLHSNHKGNFSLKVFILASRKYFSIIFGNIYCKNQSLKENTD